MKKIMLAMLVILSASVLAFAESCTSVGATDKKYTPQGSCDYKTETRTCCEDGTWSDWDKACPYHSCGSDECWDGSECINWYEDGYWAPDSEWDLECMRLNCPSGYVCGHSPTCEYGNGWNYYSYSGVSCLKIPGTGYYTTSTVNLGSCTTNAGYIENGEYYRCPEILEVRWNSLLANYSGTKKSFSDDDDEIRRYCKKHYGESFLSTPSCFITAGSTRYLRCTVYTCR